MHSFSARHRFHALLPHWNAFARFKIDHFISYSCCLSFNSHMCLERAVILKCFLCLKVALWYVVVACLEFVHCHVDVCLVQPTLLINVLTNVGKTFLQLIDTHFGAGHPLRKFSTKAISKSATTAWATWPAL